MNKKEQWEEEILSWSSTNTISAESAIELFKQVLQKEKEEMVGEMVETIDNTSMHISSTEIIRNIAKKYGINIK